MTRPSPLTLYGFRPSVYCWIVRLALELRGAEATWIEVDPFDDPGRAYRSLHPFGRVPTLVHDGFVLYETAAIVRYLDSVLPGPRFTASEPRQAARQAQIVGLLDAYAYQPLVRAVFGHGVYRPRLGEPADPARRQQGLDAAGPVLAALDALGAADLPLADLAGLHLYPMLHYFQMDPAGRALLDRHGRLAGWHERLAARPEVVTTTPELPTQARRG